MREADSTTAATTLRRGELVVGAAVRHQGVGSGRIDRFDDLGARGVYVVVKLLPNDVTTMLPLGRALDTLRPVLSESELAQALRVIGENGERLACHWKERKKAGERLLRKSGPSAWAMLLRDYAAAARDGMQIRDHDGDLVRDTIDLLAAEYATAADAPFDEARDRITATYRRAAQ